VITNRYSTIINPFVGIDMGMPLDMLLMMLLVQQQRDRELRFT
jgi:hypothetical protein